jgi:hypothetical protein
MPNIYEGQRALAPRRSAFNLSYSKQFACDLGQLIPVMCDEVIPGDIFKIGAEIVVRFNPMLTPVLHEINAFVHYFFVPYRLVDTSWEGFITGGVDGADSYTLPRWTPTGGNVTNDDGTVVADNAIGSLWDMFGFPTGVVPAGVLPMAYVRRAYNRVWNEYYRDETLQTAISEDSTIVKNRAWEKDFFTSALPWQQRGTAPALPVTLSGTLSVAAVNADIVVRSSGGANRTLVATNPLIAVNAASAWDVTGNLRWVTPSMSVDASGATATTFNIADLRLAFSIQKWMERNARGGARYTEFLRNHFGVAPRDDRLNRCEYLGGTKLPVMVSEVLQTSEAGTTPQGTMAGHGLVAGADFCASYKVQEFGIIIGIMSIMPKPAYYQGVNRQWLRITRYDFFMPEFAHLSEQAVVRGEIYADASSPNNLTIFGYQGRHNEMRSKQNMVCGLMRPGAGNLGQTWNMVRAFGAAPALNETFIRCVPRKEWLAVTNKPACLVHFANKIKAIRPLPIESDPGLIDH